MRHVSRSVFACASEELALSKIEADLGAAASCRNPEAMIVRLQDKEAECWSCGTKVSDVGMIPRVRMSWRNVYFVSLRSSARTLQVSDWICESCGTIVKYEGSRHGVLSVTRSRIYSRFVLDAINELVCLFGATFCAAVGSIRATQRAASIKANESGDPDARALRTAFRVYLKVIGDAPGCPGSMSTFFRCLNGCECPSGSMRSLIIDGTATGTLNVLPKFDRPFTVLSAMKPRAAEMRFLIRKQSGGEPCREAIRFLLRHAAENFGVGDEVAICATVVPKSGAKKIYGREASSHTAMPLLYQYGCFRRYQSCSEFNNRTGGMRRSFYRFAVSTLNPDCPIFIPSWLFLCRRRGDH
jgi:hypothetical protein